MENESLNSSDDTFTDSVTYSFDLFNPEESCLEKYKQKFELQWTANRQFSLEDCLVLVRQECPDIDIEDISSLFRDLLTIDINKGYFCHSPVSRQEYIKRFPQWKDIICDVDDQVNLTTMAKTHSLEGQRIEKYDIKQMIGRGGMGLVFRAYDTKLDRTIALKLLLPRWKQQPQSLELFKQEMHIMAQMPSGSPFVVIYDEGVYNGDPFIVMEYIEGVTLISYLNQQKNNRLDYKTVLDFTIQIANGLQTVHSQNILHRDIKPDNIMVQNVISNTKYISTYKAPATVLKENCSGNYVTKSEINDNKKFSSEAITERQSLTGDANLYPNGRIRILDLGLGRFQTSNIQEVLTTQTQKTQKQSKEQIIGAVAYMAPECVSNPQFADARCDIYSLGRTILFLLTGEHPTAWYNPFNYNSDKPISLSRYFANNSVQIPSKFVTLLEQMMETDVSKRIENTTVLLQRLSELQEPKQKPSWRFSVTFIVGFVLLGIVLMSGAYLHSWHTLVSEARSLLNDVRTLQKNSQYVEGWEVIIRINNKYLPCSEQTELILLRAQFATSLVKEKINPDYFITNALEACDEYLKIEPESLEGLKLRAEVEFLAGTMEDELFKNKKVYKDKRDCLQRAFKDIVTVLKEEPRDVPALLLAGKINLELYLYNDDITLLTTAIDIFQDILDTYNPRSLEAMIWLAKAQRYNENYNFALLLLNRVLNIDEHNIEARRLRAHTNLVYIKNYIFAAEDMLYILNSPDLAVYAKSSDYVLLIRSLYEMQEYENCVTYCTLLLDSKDPSIKPIELLELRGKALKALGKNEEAENDFQKVEELRLKVI